MGGKPSRSMEVRVGALVLAALVLLIGFVLLLGDWRFGERADVVIDYGNSGDLKVGAPVKVSGVTVGKVAAVDLWGGRPDPLRDNKPVFVRVTVRIDAAAHAMLHEDAEFLITTLGVLGERYVEIDPGSPGRPALAAGKVVDGVAPVRIEAIASEAGALVADIKQVLGENKEDVRAIVKKTRETVDHVDEVVRSVGGDVREATARLNRIAGAVSEATGDGQDLKRLLASLRSFAEKLDRDVSPVLPDLKRIADKVERAVDEAGAAMTDVRGILGGDVRQAIANVRVFTQALRDPKGTVGALLTDRELYDDLVAFMKDVKRHPWKLIMKE